MLAQGHHSRQTSPKGRRECNTYRSQRMDLRGSRTGKTDALERYYSKTSRERRAHTSASSIWHRRRGHKFRKYLGGKWVQIWWLIPCRQHGTERNDKCFPSFCFRDWVDCETMDMIQSTGSGMHLEGGGRNRWKISFGHAAFECSWDSQLETFTRCLISCKAQECSEG